MALVLGAGAIAGIVIAVIAALIIAYVLKVRWLFVLSRYRLLCRLVDRSFVPSVCLSFALWLTTSEWRQALMALSFMFILS